MDPWDVQIVLTKRDEAILRYLGVRRWSRVCAYGLLSSSGAASLTFPALLVSDQVGRGTVIIDSIVVTAGAALCFIGSLADRWIIEYVILPLLVIALFVFGAAAIFASHEIHDNSLIAVGLMLMAFGSGFLARWQDVRAISKVRRAEIRYNENRTH